MVDGTLLTLIITSLPRPQEALGHARQFSDAPRCWLFFYRNLFENLNELGPDAFLQHKFGHHIKAANFTEDEFRMKFRQWVGVGKEQPIAMGLHLMGHFISSKEQAAIKTAQENNATAVEFEYSEEATAPLHLPAGNTETKAPLNLAEGTTETKATPTFFRKLVF